MITADPDNRLTLAVAAVVADRLPYPHGHLRERQDLAVGSRLRPQFVDLVLPAHAARAKLLRHGLIAPLRVDVRHPRQPSALDFLQGTNRRTRHRAPVLHVVRLLLAHARTSTVSASCG